MFVNFGYVGGESVYRGLSGNIGKRTQENPRERKSFGIFPGVHRLYSLMFRGLSCFIVFLSATSHIRKTPDRHDASGVGRVYSVGGGGSGVFLHASALNRFVRVYIGSNSAGNRG